MIKRSPVVVVVGHVDHGKTSLLDYIRKTSLASREAGGITQSVGAYEVTRNDQKITFIDTPGHEAFSKMRSRGANIADLAILVVAATDGAQKQTKEAVKILKETDTPFVVAINKIDQDGADIDKTKNQLTQEGVLLEGYGGNISWCGVSAKTGEGINDLLDLILLLADVEELTYDNKKNASGYVLESRMDDRKGVMISAIIKDGTLKTGDYIRAGEIYGRVKILNDFAGTRMEKLSASSPAVIFGFESLPKAGDVFETSVVPFAKPVIATETTFKPLVTKTLSDKRSLNLILKSDSSGGLEALSEILKSLPAPYDMRIEIENASIGTITDGDIKNATAHKAAIIAFKVGATKAAEALAVAQLVTVVKSEIIYDLTKAVEAMLKAGTVAKIIGRLELLAVFGKKGVSKNYSIGKQQIIGGKVIEGEIKNNTHLDVTRKNIVIGKGKVINLQSDKKNLPRVETPNECGLLFDADVEVKVGDVLILR